MTDVGLQFVKLIGNAEEEGAIDFVYRTTFGNGQWFLGCVQVGVWTDFILDDTYLRSFHDTLHEKGTCCNQTHFNGDGKIEYHREEEGEEEYNHIALGIAEQPLEGAPPTHVVAHNHQHGSQTGHGDVFGVWHQDEQDEQQHSGMNEACHWGASAIVDIGHGARDGTCGRNASEQGRHDVGHALCHQFHVAVMLVADYTVGHSRTEEALDGTQDSNREGHRHQFLYHADGDGGHHHIGELCLNVEAVTDGVDALNAQIILEEIYGYGAQHNTIERPGNLVEHLDAACEHGSEDDEQQAADGHAEVPGIERVDVLGIAYPFAHKVARCLQRDANRVPALAHSLLGEAQNVAHLGGEDGNSNTCREAHDNGIRDKLDDSPQAEHAQCHQYHASQDGGDEQALQAILRIGDNTIDDDDECARGATNLHFGPSQQGDEETSNNGGDDALFGSHSAGNAECNGQWQGHNAYDHTSHKVFHKCAPVIPFQAFQQAGSHCKSFHVVKIVW